MPSTEGRAPDPRPARTRAAIFAAARDLSATDGEVTVNALARRAGVSRAAFYSHFSGLDDLMGAILRTMFDLQYARAVEMAADGRTTQEMVQSSVATMVAYVERHHAFLRGALDWKSSHSTYLILVTTLSGLHVNALKRVADQMPPQIPMEQTARYFAGGTLDVLIQWLVETGGDAHAGKELADSGLTEVILRLLPSWYTGLQPQDPIPADLVVGDLFADTLTRDD
ncbi:TetR/AcrR family transcriptional regulator [Brachybacterium sp. 107]|uniref:TetR/AcrR family transcriptional regulator n=1 Tax=Brachybacterium sp. 107 TaxID=3457736 RepID=UPI0040333B01